MKSPLTIFSGDPATMTILDSIADGVFTVDDDWRITSFNRAAEQITGVPSGAAVGTPCRDVFQANICDAGCVLRRTRETGCPSVNQPVQILNAQGHRVPISVSTAVLRNNDGCELGGVETFRDLSTVEQLRDELRAHHSCANILGRSEPMRQLFDILPQVAASNSTILIEGASGTGKELFARAVHDLSLRSGQRFVGLNCGALPDTLLESELFGHCAGAFTDARHDKPGRFLLADGGTLLLDEISDISMAMQTKLLRVLQERVVEPLGGVEPIPVDVRVIAATNRNLSELVAEGKFREDLYYRIHVIKLELPSLRQRRSDIPLLTEHLVVKFNRLQSRHISAISDEAAAILREHDYPGNVRELENIIEHAFVLCRGSVIGVEHLPPELRGACSEQSPSIAVPSSLDDLEAVHISAALRRHDGNRQAVALELGIHPTTLYRKIKRLKIAVPDHDGRRRSA